MSSQALSPPRSHLLSIARWGNSFAVRLTGPLAAQLAVSEGAELALRACHPRPVSMTAPPAAGAPSVVGFSEEEQAPFDVGAGSASPSTGLSAGLSHEHRVTVGRWGNSLAVRLPRALVLELGLTEGDRVSFADGGGVMDVTRELTVDELFARIRGLRGALPADVGFDREEANERDR